MTNIHERPFVRMIAVFLVGLVPGIARGEGFFMDWIPGAFSNPDLAGSAIQRFAEEHRATGDPLLLAQWGAALLTRALHAPPFQRRVYFNNGFRHLDSAVQVEPDNRSIRLLRATVTSLLPAAAGRSGQTGNDFSRLLELEKREPSSNPRLSWEIHYRAAGWHLKEGDYGKALHLLEAAREFRTGDAELFRRVETLWQTARSLAEAETKP